MEKKENVVVVRIRGIRNMKPGIKKTLELLRLHRPNHAVIFPQTAQLQGMLNKVKDYVGYGTIKPEILLALIKKRGESGGKFLKKIHSDTEMKNMATEISNGKKVAELMDPVFRLHPPDRGYKDKKRAYPMGDLGKRDMNELIKRMI